LPKEVSEGIYLLESDTGELLATRNLVPGQRVYGERLVQEGFELRVWDPYRSKLAAAIRKGLKTIPIKPGSVVLYLGAAAGTTVSHVSDIVGKEGVVYAVEFAARSMRELITSCESRKNVIPVLADARQPLGYRDIVDSVDVVYEDVAQPDQAKILIDNSRIYLRPGGYAMIAVKSRSVDVAAEPETVFAQEKKTLEEGNMKVVEEVELSPFEKDHKLMVAAIQRTP
jgi:fibrillarin-like pre-rRNA processing protein